MVKSETWNLSKIEQSQISVYTLILNYHVFTLSEKYEIENSQVNMLFILIHA